MVKMQKSHMAGAKSGSARTQSCGVGFTTELGFSAFTRQWFVTENSRSFCWPMKLLAAALSVAAAAAAAAPTLIDVYHRAQTDSANVSYFCFRIPVLARAASGALIAFAEGRHLNCDDAGDVRIVRRISHDDGATWSPIDQVKAEAGHTIGNPCPIVDLVTGTVHLIYSRDNREIFVTRSTDGGLTWGASANLTAALAFTLDPTNAFAASGPPAACSSRAAASLAQCTMSALTDRGARRC